MLSRLERHWRPASAGREAETQIVFPPFVAWVEEQPWRYGVELLAVSCCLEMALRRTLWTADHVSRMTTVVCIFHEVADELLGVISRAACGLQDERDKVDVWISINFDLLCSLGHVIWAGRAGLLEKGGTMATSINVVTPF